MLDIKAMLLEPQISIRTANGISNEMSQIEHEISNLEPTEAQRLDSLKKLCEYYIHNANKFYLNMMTEDELRLIYLGYGRANEIDMDQLMMNSETAYNKEYQKQVMTRDSHESEFHELLNKLNNDESLNYVPKIAEYFPPQQTLEVINAQLSNLHSEVIIEF